MQFLACDHPQDTLEWINRPEHENAHFNRKFWEDDQMERKPRTPRKDVLFFRKFWEMPPHSSLEISGNYIKIFKRMESLSLKMHSQTLANTLQIISLLCV